MPHVQACYTDEHGNIIPDQKLSESFGNDYDPVNKQKKVGYYQAKLSNFCKTGFGGKKIKNVRLTNNIMKIEQVYDSKDEVYTNKFEILYKKQVGQDEDIEDRKVDYECENVETACYIVAKIKTQM